MLQRSAYGKYSECVPHATCPPTISAHIFLVARDWPAQFLAYTIQLRKQWTNSSRINFPNEINASFRSSGCRTSALCPFIRRSPHAAIFETTKMYVSSASTVILLQCTWAGVLRFSRRYAHLYANFSVEGLSQCNFQYNLKSSLRAPHVHNRVNIEIPCMIVLF